MFKYAAVLVSSLTLFATPASSQKTISGSAPQFQNNAVAGNEAVYSRPSGDLQQRMQEVMVARAMADRQAQLRIDTEKLVALTAELKQHVDKAGPNILSMDVIKKAQEIQKLAKSVQDKMRNAY
jgi:hypothetical protein